VTIFFHADAHPGNIWSTQRVAKIHVLLHWTAASGLAAGARPVLLAENFMAMFERDYKRMPNSTWPRLVPAHVRVDELEAAVRTVCEPYFTRRWWKSRSAKWWQSYFPSRAAMNNPATTVDFAAERPF